MTPNRFYRKLLFTLAAAATCFLAACAPQPYQDYPGPPLPSDQVAILKTVGSFGGLYNPTLKITAIDNQDFSPGYTCPFILLPGIHVITFVPGGYGESGDAIAAKVRFIAGKTYTARKHVSDVHDAPTDFTQPIPLGRVVDFRWGIRISEDN